MPTNVKTTRNLLLLSLSEAVRQELLDASELVHLDLHERIYEANEEITYVDFPETGVMSVVRQNDKGKELEIVTTGYEGLVGVAVVLDALSVSQRAFCQVEGSCSRIKTDVFLKIVEKHPELKTTLLRYIATVLDQMACNLVCNHSHEVLGRCAKWLLFTHDRMHKNQFVLTQEFLAIMLGISRTNVNAAAGELAQAGIIKYARGKVDILDREGLEAKSCSCYKTVTDYFHKCLTLRGFGLYAQDAP